MNKEDGEEVRKKFSTIIALKTYQNHICLAICGCFLTKIYV